LLGNKVIKVKVLLREEAPTSATHQELITRDLRHIRA
jgi:hypothetical protein